MIFRINLLQRKNFTPLLSQVSSNDCVIRLNCLRYLSEYPCQPPSPLDYSKYKVIFIGSDSFSLPTLIELTKLLTPENVSVVVSHESNLVGKCAQKQNNKIYLWNDYKAAKTVEDSHYDLGVVASFGFLIPARVINRFPLGILNVHASLLPRWRGASPINHSIMFGDTETGVSIMKIAPHRFDVGPVFLKKAVSLDGHIRAPELKKILANLGAAALIEVIKDLPRFLRNPIYQDDSLATLAPKLTPEMAEVDWESKTAVEIYRLFRGLYGTFKLRTTFDERRVDLDEIELPEVTSELILNIKENNSASKCEWLSRGVPGQIVHIKNSNTLLVRCANSSGISTWISVKKVKIGLKWMTANDFRNGFLSKGKLSSNAIPRFYLSKSVIEDKLSQR